MNTMLKEPEAAVEPRMSKAEAIERAAFQLFEARGYGDVSMDEIAKVAGVSKATIYSHFPDKAQLFASLMRAKCAMNWVRTELESRPVDAESVQTNLTEVARAYTGALSEKGPGTRIVIAEGRRFPELAQVFYENGVLAARLALKNYLDRACAAGSLQIDDTDRAANQFFATLRDDTYLRILLGLPVENPEAEIKASVKAAIDLFLRAYAPQR